MGVDVERALVDACREGRVEALGETLGDDELVRDDGELGRPLEALRARVQVSAEVEREGQWRKRTHLEQLGEERDEVGPLVDVVERLERLLDGESVLAVLGIVLEGCAHGIVESARARASTLLRARREVGRRGSGCEVAPSKRAESGACSAPFSCCTAWANESLSCEWLAARLGSEACAVSLDSDGDAAVAGVVVLAGSI